ncbi:MAG TPA: 16S rRNA (cytosine(1402)-N(4))-methyltransferase RsmH [Saprospiraceae bacterium]|nr:16S rRNA (cytosine(1402)-N(4))-methyltransferase [Saprospirales bacterium]HRQ31385.1 16S rRNA (cytosine(1402)-N(4))-methyltransferase RsmH [Saprospiraceae bacterium]
MIFHKPILLNEVIEGLNIVPHGVYCDFTFGGGGHSRKILEKLGAKGRLVAFDQDEKAIENVWDDDRLILIRSNFRYADKFLRYLGIEKVDGVLADLGVSSHQLDVDSRGFTYRDRNELDMRMNRKQKLNAVDILNTYSESELVSVFSGYGEIRNSKQLAKAFVRSRMTGKIRNSSDIDRIIGTVIKGEKNRYLAQLYQAIRIEVNDEFGALKQMLGFLENILKPGGRLTVISFHSLEDRFVKNLIKKSDVEGNISTDIYGRQIFKFREVVKGVVVAGKEELYQNSRAKSAKLRIAERL